MADDSAPLSHLFAQSIARTRWATGASGLCYRQHDHATTLCAFDLLELDGADTRSTPIEERKQHLASDLRRVKTLARLSLTGRTAADALGLRKGSVQFLRSPFCKRDDFRSHPRHFIGVVHPHCLPVVLIDFLQAGFL
jgi:hypothetical protein